MVNDFIDTHLYNYIYHYRYILITYIISYILIHIIYIYIIAHLDFNCIPQSFSAQIIFPGAPAARR